MKTINSPICYFDLESTGLCTTTSKILQIAGVCNNEDKSIFQSYVMPPPNFEITNSFIHNITKETLIENSAPPFDTVMNRFIDFMNETFGNQIIYMIAHNNFGYDMNLLESQCKEFNITIPSNWRFYDSLYQFRKYNSEIGYGNFALGKLYQNIIGGVPDGEFHNAITDVKALMEIHEKLTLSKFKDNKSYKEEIEANCKKSTCNIDFTQEPLTTIIHNNDKIVKQLNMKGFKTVNDLYKNYKKIVIMKSSFDDYLKIMGITSSFMRNKISNQLGHIYHINF